MIKPGMFISDRYEIIDKVGSGGMADVYKAKCHRLNRYVAIKILKSEYSNDKNFVSKFRAEAQSAAGLSHPNIVNVYDVGDDDGLYYIVMELVEGITLKRFIERKGKLEVKEAVGITIQIAQGMEAAHGNHIIHRDIKPQNIIISRDGKVKVTDFGIAKAATSNTVTHTALGSVHYLSPEQARGGYSDEKSDIYSLGVTLYEMLTGKVPFAGDNTVSVALLHIQSEAMPVRELDAGIPVSIDKIVQKCMQKKPERRYLSASDLITDLKRSILNPDGDFVELSSGAVSDSPTILMTDDELNTIKSAAKTPVTYYDNNNKSQEKVMKKIQREDEEEIDSVDSRFEKFLVIGTVVVAVMLGVAVIYLAASFFGIFDSWGKKDTDTTPTPELTVTVSVTPTEEPNVEVSGELIPMISVLGLKQEDAEKNLKTKSEDFQIYADDVEYSTEFEKGMVMKQYPIAGTDVLSNSRIDLTISLGAEPKEIPPVSSLTKEAAEKALSELGFTPIISPEVNDEIPENIAIRTEPESGTIAFQGDVIKLYISLGADKTLIPVPDIRGKTEQQAILDLADAGLKAGKPSYIYSDIYAAGLICYQSTTPGEKITSEVAIDYSISLGAAEPTPTPKQEPITYKGSFTLRDNPFNPGDYGEILIILLQPDGDDFRETILAEKTMYYEDIESHPTFTFNSKTGGTANIDVYVNGTLWQRYPIEFMEN